MALIKPVLASKTKFSWFFILGHQVQCSGWCYSEAEADTGNNQKQDFCWQDLDTKWCFPPSVQLCVDNWEVQPDCCIVQAWQDYVQRPVCGYGEWEGDKVVATIIIERSCNCHLTGGGWRCTRMVESFRTPAMSHSSSRTLAGLLPGSHHWNHTKNLPGSVRPTFGLMSNSVWLMLGMTIPTLRLL